MVFQTYRKTAALLLSALYVFFIGFGHLPLNFGATVFFISWYTVILILARIEQIHIHLKLYTVVLLGFVLAVYLSITSNPLLVPITYVCNLFVLSLLLITFNQRTLFPLSATRYLKKLWDYTDMVVRGFFSGSQFPSYFSWKGSDRKISWPHKNYTLGLIVTLPILAIFNKLFISINADYAYFIDHIWLSIWHVLVYIFNIVVIWKLITTGILGYVAYSILQPYSEEKPLVSSQSYIALQIVKVLLVSVVLLFCLFSVFQSQTLFMRLGSLPFKELSLYTQHGFWQLLIVSVLGFALVSTLFRFAGKALWDHVSNKILVGIFLIELLLICLFTYHKLFSLQYFFGLKDQRVLATAAVTLISMTFVLLLGKLLGKIRSSTILTFQMFGLLAVILGLNVANLDSVITTTRPIRYVVDGKQYKDYSYLLTNSYDNNSSWLGLMREFERSDVKFPHNYYWGNYHSLCDVPSLENHWIVLDRKYSGKDRPFLQSLSQFNIHEYQAYTLIVNHRLEINNFTRSVYDTCYEQRTGISL